MKEFAARWCVPVVLGLFVLVILLREAAPQTIFASEQERVQFLQEIDEPSSIRVVALVTDWCPACRSLESSLNSAKIPFARVNIEQSEPGRKLFERCIQAGGSRGIPKVILDREMVSARAVFAAFSAGGEGAAKSGSQ